MQDGFTEGASSERPGNQGLNLVAEAIRGTVRADNSGPQSPVAQLPWASFPHLQRTVVPKVCED